MPGLSHFLKFTLDRPFTCEICGKTWVKLGKLRDHLKTHSTEKNELCDLCGRAFKTRAELKDHKTDAHTAGDRCTFFFRFFFILGMEAPKLLSNVIYRWPEMSI